MVKVRTVMDINRDRQHRLPIKIKYSVGQDCSGVHVGCEIVEFACPNGIDEDDDKRWAMMKVVPCMYSTGEAGGSASWEKSVRLLPILPSGRVLL